MNERMPRVCVNKLIEPARVRARGACERGRDRWTPAGMMDGSASARGVSGAGPFPGGGAWPRQNGRGDPSGRAWLPAGETLVGPGCGAGRGFAAARAGLPGRGGLFRCDPPGAWLARVADDGGGGLRAGRGAAGRGGRRVRRVRLPRAAELRAGRARARSPRGRGGGEPGARRSAGPCVTRPRPRPRPPSGVQARAGGAALSGADAAPRRAGPAEPGAEPERDPAGAVEEAAPAGRPAPPRPARPPRRPGRSSRAWTRPRAAGRPGARFSLGPAGANWGRGWVARAAGRTCQLTCSLLARGGRGAWCAPAGPACLLAGTPEPARIWREDRRVLGLDGGAVGAVGWGGEFLLSARLVGRVGSASIPWT